MVSKMADKLARQASAMLLLGPEPALGIPKCLAREAIKSWTEYQHSNTWKTVPGCRHGKHFILSIMTVKHNSAFLLTCYFINYRMS